MDEAPTGTRGVDWSLRGCARHGHVTYEPTDDDAAVASLRARTDSGDLWRCLRCGAYVPGPPTTSGPLADAPRVPRGVEIRDAVVIKVLAAERALRALVFVAAAFAVWRYQDHIMGFADFVRDELPALQPGAEQIGWNLDHSWVSTLAEGVADLGPSAYVTASGLLVAYAVLLGTESFGLLSGRRWGEYFSVVSTSVFLPTEVLDIAHHVTWFNVGLFLFNLAAVAWLVWTKYLFGVRGGEAAYRQAHHAEAILPAPAEVTEASAG